jgi:hypothetical protein
MVLQQLLFNLRRVPDPIRPDNQRRATEGMGLAPINRTEGGAMI